MAEFAFDTNLLQSTKQSKNEEYPRMDLAMDRIVGSLDGLDVSIEKLRDRTSNIRHSRISDSINLNEMIREESDSAPVVAAMEGFADRITGAYLRLNELIASLDM